MNQGYKNKEEELKEEYNKFIVTKEGKEWKDNWRKRVGDDVKLDDIGDIGDFLYDFYPEMLQ